MLQTAPILRVSSILLRSLRVESSAMSKTILVTGGSRGIGRAACLLAAQRGWSVGVNYLKDQRGGAVGCREVGALRAGRPSRWRETCRARATSSPCSRPTTNALGPLDGVVVNAGVAATTSRLVDMSVERMRLVFDVNVLGAFLCAREAARRMSKSRGGPGGSMVVDLLGRRTDWRARHLCRLRRFKGRSRCDGARLVERIGPRRRAGQRNSTWRHRNGNSRRLRRARAAL